jgi:hypothetical protein
MWRASFVHSSSTALRCCAASGSFQIAAPIKNLAAVAAARKDLARSRLLVRCVNSAVAILLLAVGVALIADQDAGIKKSPAPTVGLGKERPFGLAERADL